MTATLPIVFDTNHDVTRKLPQLKASGVKVVIRYISTNTTGEKCIKPAEARAIGAAGIELALVFEVYGGVDGFRHHDITAVSGKMHGVFAREWAARCGAPSGAVIYFAIDTDVTDQHVRGLVLPYFAAVKVAMGGQYRIGVYGCGAVCAAALDAGTAVLAWLSNAMGWNGSRAFKASGRGVLVQRLPATIAGLDTDPDDAVHEGADFGAFVPFASNPAPAPAPPVAPPLQPLPSPPPPAPPAPGAPQGQGAQPRRMLAIIMTCEGGRGDPERNPYGPGLIDPTKLLVALPKHFEGVRPKVRIIRGDKSVVCEIGDVGPHHTNDPYWETGRRPLAESDHGSNHAGIDATPPVFKALGIGPGHAEYGLAKIDFEIITS